MEDHGCEAVVITCIDFRLQDYINGWIGQNLGSRNHDRVALAGGVKDWEIVLNQIKISKMLHDIKKVVLINHEDCGAYGEEGTLEKHTQDLQNASDQIKKNFDLAVDSYFLTLDGNFQQV